MRIKLYGENGIFVLSDEDGVRIYNIEPLAEIGRLDVGSVVASSNVARTNMVSLIGGGERPKFCQNTLVVYDAAINDSVIDITFGTPLTNTIMTRDTLIGTLVENIFVYSIPDGRLLLQGRTGKNPRGLVEYKANRLVVPGHKVGSIHVYDISSLREKKISSPPIQIYAHQGAIECIALSTSGSKAATASDKGTLIRVFDTVTKQRLAEFRRGADPAKIYSISFSKDSSFLAVTSDKGTLHLFALRDKVLNRKSAFAAAGRVSVIASNYADSMWALATAPIPEEKVTQVAFIGINRLVCVCGDSSIHYYQFSPEGTVNRTEVRHLDELEMSSDNW